MTNAGISDGDLLIVDRALDVKNDSIIVAIVNGEFTVKRFKKEKDKVVLYPENPNYEPIIINDEMGFEVWGVVSSVIKKLA